MQYGGYEIGSDICDFEKQVLLLINTCSFLNLRTQILSRISGKLFSSPDH